MCASPKSPTEVSQESTFCFARCSLPVRPTLWQRPRVPGVAVETQKSWDLGSESAKGAGPAPCRLRSGVVEAVLVLAEATPMGEAPGAGGGGTKEGKAKEGG